MFTLKYDGVTDPQKLGSAIATGFAVENVLKDLDMGRLMDRIMVRFSDKIGTSFVIYLGNFTQHLVRSHSFYDRPQLRIAQSSIC